MMVFKWTTNLEVLSDLKHLGSMEELNGEREQVAQLVQVHRISSGMHIDRGSCLQRCHDKMQLRSPFVIDAKGGETQMGTCSYGEHELLSTMTKGEIVGYRLSLMPTTYIGGPVTCM